MRLAVIFAVALARPALCFSSPRTFGRCEPWSGERAALLDVVNVIGRFKSSADWCERSEFAVVDAKATTNLQALTVERRDLARRLAQVERAAFVANVPRLPFTDEALARSVGMNVAAFAEMEVTPGSLSVVFDALAHSKTTLVSKASADARIASWRRPDGSLDEEAFALGLRKGLAIVLAAYAWSAFLVSCGFAIAAKVGSG